MKKFVLSLVAVISIIMMSVSFTACDNASNKSTSYSITYQQGENYTITSGVNQAKAGDIVTFKVESTSVFYTVGKVTMNGNELSESNLGYSFAMPRSNVEIKVEMLMVGEYDDSSDRLSWGSTVNGIIPTAHDSVTSLNIPLEFVGITSGNYISSITDAIYSSNEEVIPTDAIEFVAERVSNGNSIVGGHLAIDLTKVSEGEAYIYISLVPNNSRLGTLIKKFTVVDSQDYQEETMDVTFTYDNKTSYQEGNIFFNIKDTETEVIETIYLSEFIDGKLSFKYAGGHTYQVTCAYAVYNEDKGAYDITNLYLSEWVGTNVGGAVNELDRDGQSGRYILTLTTEGVTVPFTITEL